MYPILHPDMTKLKKKGKKNQGKKRSILMLLRKRKTQQRNATSDI